MADKLTIELSKFFGLEDCTKATIELSADHPPIITKTQYFRDKDGKFVMEADSLALLKQKIKYVLLLDEANDGVGS